MKAEIEKTLEIIKERLEMNKQIIDENRKLLKYVINQPLSDDRTEMFIIHFKHNIGLYSSNFMYLKLQHELQRAIDQEDGLKTFGMMSLS